MRFAGSLRYKLVNDDQEAILVRAEAGDASAETESEWNGYR
jgi:hypothetical protein